MLWPALSLLVVGFAIACPMTWIVRSVGRRMGALDSPGSGGHVKELRPIPNVGGVAIFLGVGIPLLLACAVLTFMEAATLRDLLPAIEPYLPRLQASSSDRASSVQTAWAMLASIVILHVMGLIDDRRGLGPFVKLGVQAAIGCMLAIWFDVRLLELLGPVPSVLITVGWIIIITNAVNFLDNMDGLAAGVSAIAATFLMCATLLNEQWFIASMLALLIGSLVGFLVFNFPPASIFMGDGGSLVVGFLLAVLTARTTYFGGDLGVGWYGVLMPVVVLAIPLYDFTSVTLIRLRQGKSPFVGDQQHFSHRLVQRGLSKRGAVVIIWCYAGVTGVGGIALGHLELWQAILVVFQTFFLLVTLALLEHASRRRVDLQGPESERSTS